MDAKELLLMHLERIGFKLKFCGCEHYLIQNNNGIDTEYMFWDTSITRRTAGAVSEFKIEEENVYYNNDNSFFIGNDKNYVMFMNHDI